MLILKDLGNLRMTRSYSLMFRGTCMYKGHKSFEKLKIASDNNEKGNKFGAQCAEAFH